MATLKAAVLPREFYYHGSRIPDPNPQMSVEDVDQLFRIIREDQQDQEIRVSTSSGLHRESPSR
jgi:PRTRC genetic system protein C